MDTSFFCHETPSSFAAALSHGVSWLTGLLFVCLIRHYTGSLTTPPCQTKVGANVQWFVMQTPITIAADQMFTFTSYFANLEKAYNGRVNRPLQDVLATTTIYVNDEAPAPASPSRRRRNRIGNIRH